MGYSAIIRSVTTLIPTHNDLALLVTCKGINSMLLNEEVDTRNSIPFSTNIESNLLVSIKGNFGTRGFN